MQLFKDIISFIGWTSLIVFGLLILQQVAIDSEHNELPQKQDSYEYEYYFNKL